MELDLDSVPAGHVMVRWRYHSAAVREEFVLPSSSSLWTGRADVKLQGVPACPRIVELLDIAWAVHLQEMALRGEKNDKVQHDPWSPPKNKTPG